MLTRILPPERSRTLYERKQRRNKSFLRSGLIWIASRTHIQSSAVERVNANFKSKVGPASETVSKLRRNIDACHEALKRLVPGLCLICANLSMRGS